MNNGLVVESRDQTATLDVAVDVLVACCEFVCTGDYKTPTTASNADRANEIEFSDPKSILLQDSGKESSESFLRNPSEFKKSKKAKNKAWGLSKRPDDELGYRPPFLAPIPTSNDPVDLNMWKGFRDLKFYGCRSQESQVEKDRQPNLPFHAELYAFTEEKLMKDVQDCCLQHLHDELLIFDIENQAGDLAMLLQLLRFAYQFQTRTSFYRENRLRKIIIHYVACKIKFLAKEKSFLTILDSYGKIGSELICQLC